MKKQDLLDNMKSYLVLLVKDYQDELNSEKEKTEIKTEFKQVVRAYKHLLLTSYKNGKAVHITENIETYIIELECEREYAKYNK